jgi:hypothetical protein
MKKTAWLVGLMAAGIGIYYVAFVGHPTAIEKLFSREVAAHDSTTVQEQSADAPKKLLPHVFDSLDEYAKNTPAEKSVKTEKLAAHLALRAKNDLEKARLIYAWIAHHIYYDVVAYTSEVNPKHQYGAQVLQRRKAVCDGYSNLFLDLATAMDLEAVKIVGYSKGFGYKKGQRFSETDHAWNAVKIDGEWKLLDVTWGSGFVMEVNKKLKSKLEFDNYWFCTKPEEFIFSHLPKEQSWQLVSTPLSLRQYEKLPPLYSTFFKIGFDAHEVLQKGLTGEVKQFVDTYSINFPVKRIALPMEKTLQRGKAYAFEIQSPYAHKIAIVDNGQWTYLERKEDTFKVNYVPKGEAVKIVQKINASDKVFNTILEYTVGAKL